MSPDEVGKHLENITPGTLVEIYLKGDRSGSHPVKGIVKEILSHSPFHPYGIMVRLEDGKVGRVQNILSEICAPNQEIPRPEERELDFPTLISKGENEFVEFKSSALWSKSLTENDFLYYIEFRRKC